MLRRFDLLDVQHFRNGLFDVKEDVELPNLIGTRWTDVKDDAAYSGFVLEKEEVFDDEAPVGEIVTRIPVRRAR
ncbi:MAG: hypothetical protein ACLR7U_07355 [Ruthenibacterium lactatiformans]